MVKTALAFILHNKKILLLHRDNIPTITYPDRWSTIGGNVEEGETFDEAIKREIKEETGCMIKKAKLESVLHKKIKAKGLNYLCIRAVFGTSVYSKAIMLSDEHLSYDWFDVKKIRKLKLLPGTEEILNKMLK